MYRVVKLKSNVPKFWIAVVVYRCILICMYSYFVYVDLTGHRHKRRCMFYNGAISLVLYLLVCGFYFTGVRQFTLDQNHLNELPCLSFILGIVPARQVYSNHFLQLLPQTEASHIIRQPFFHRPLVMVIWKILLKVLT